MHSRSENIQILMGSETNDIIKELFKSFLQKYQEGLEKKMKATDFVFESVDLLYYGLHKTTLKRAASSYIKSYEWIRNKRATINRRMNMIITVFSIL